MTSINRIIFIIIVVCLFRCVWFLNQSTILAEDNKNDFQPIECQLMYSDDWSFLSDVTTPSLGINQIKEDEVNYIPLPNPQNPQGYHCGAERNRVRLDTNGDFFFDKEVKNNENFVVYKIKYPNGVQLDYRIRIFSKALMQNSQIAATAYPAWYYQRACYMIAKTPLETFTIIDDNNNGYFNDYGKDSIIIGAANKNAVPLSSIIMVKGEYYNLQIEHVSEIPADTKNIPNYTGMILRLTPYKGDTGKIDLASNFKAPEEFPQTSIIRRDNDAFFQLTGNSSVVVPTGNYYLVSSVLNNRVHVRGSDRTLGTVDKDKTLSPKWGSPFKLNLHPYCGKGGDIPIISQPPYSLPIPILAQEKITDMTIRTRHFNGLSAFEFATYGIQHMDCPFIKMQFPTVTGSLGEEYYATDEFKDENGLAFPDGGVVSFQVEIRPDSSGKSKPINNTVGNPYVEKWAPIDLSTQLKRATPFWEPYQCPIEKYRGKVIVTVMTFSHMFGDLLFEQEVEVKE